MKRVFNSTLALILCICMIFSGSVIALAADVATPTGVVATMSGDSKVVVKWNSVSGAAGYSIEKSTNPNDSWKEVKKNASSADYTDSDVTGGGTYYYRVRAYKKSGFLNLGKTYSDYSATAKIIVDPSKVNGLMAASTGATSVKLAWDASKGAAGYQVFIYDNATASYKKIAVTSTNSFTVKNLEETTKYKFKVRAYHKLNGVTYGTFSEEFTVSTALYDVKNFRLSSSTSRSYSISWDANENVTGFQLAKYDKESHEWQIQKFGDSFITKQTSYEVNNIKEGDNDKYKIRTVLVVGGTEICGNWSSALVGGTLPVAPTGIDAAANTDNGLTIAWEPLEGAAGYEIYCKNENGNFKSVGTTERSSFNHSNLTEKKYYEYKVRAYVGNVEDKMYGNFSESIKVFYEPLEIPESVYPEDWDETGILGYLYDPVEQCFYTADDTWQRNFGYNEIYDNTASLVVIYIETARIKFAYDNRDWMVQLWKGQYGWVLYGSEIGIYNKDPQMPVTHYDCANDEDMLQMEMVLYEKSDASPTGWKRTFGRPYERQWWHTGFVWGNKIGKYDTDLKMYARITMRDFEMRDAFIEGLLKVHIDNPGQDPFEQIKNPLTDIPKGNNVFWVGEGKNKLDVYFYWT